MFDPLEFLDPILHALEFVYQIIGTAEWYLRWMYARHEQLRNLGLFFAAIIGLPLLIWRGVSLDRSSRATQKQAENTEFQMRNLEKQAENASKSHVADTYSRAIEQLGAVDNKGEPNLELRLGGLYALEKVAKANEDYHPQIMEVLCAYVRMHCPKKIDNKKNDPKPEKNDSDIESPRMDIQACLTIIGRRNRLFNKGSKLDLSRVQINGAILATADLSEVGFFKADLLGAFLNNANLSGAYFNDANLTEAILTRANLSGAFISRADLSGAWLMEAKDLTCEQIQSAKIDRKTILPDYIKITWAEDDTYTCEMVKKPK